MKRFYLLCMISVIFICLCSCANNTNSEEETTNMYVGGIRPPYESFTGKVVEIIDNNNVVVQVEKDSYNNFNVGDLVYVEYDKFSLNLISTEDEYNEEIESIYHSIYENSELEMYFLKISLGDELSVCFEEGKINEKDGKYYVKDEMGLKNVYDPHLDPLIKKNDDYGAVSVYNSSKDKSTIYLNGEELDQAKGELQVSINRNKTACFIHTKMEIYIYLMEMISR